MVVRSRRAYVYPATHFASKLTDENLPRMGERFRLRRDFDTSELRRFKGSDFGKEKGTRTFLEKERECERCVPSSPFCVPPFCFLPAGIDVSDRLNQRRRAMASVKLEIPDDLLVKMKNHN